MLVVALLVLLPLLFLFLIKKPSRKLPPGPNLWQIFRKLSQFRKKPLTSLSNLAKIYGPLMSIPYGSGVVIVASSASTAREILQTQDTNFSGRFMPWACCIIPSVHASIAISEKCNDTWKFFRGISQNSMFSSKSIEAKARMRTAKAVEMVRHLQSKQGEAVQLDDVMDSTIHNILSYMLVSRNMYDIRREEENDEKKRAAVHQVIDVILSSLGLSDLFPFLRKIDFSSKRKATQIYRKQRYIWGDVVEQRRSASSSATRSDENRDFLDVLLENALTDDQLYIVLTELFIGATDSSVAASIWLMAELIKNPQILNRVRDEVAEAFDDETMMINETILTESQYLQACIKETLRVHHPGPLLMPHRAIETCEIDSYLIPKGSIVLVNAGTILRESGSWKDGDKFNPDRFLKEKIDFRGSHFEFIPFGFGRRMCPGFNVAFKNIQIVVASLVHFFDWSFPDGRDLDTIDMSAKFDGMLKKEKPLHLVPICRRI